jgi:hypothetical protein
MREVDRDPSSKMIKQFKMVKHNYVVPTLTCNVGKNSLEQGLPFCLQIRHRDILFPYESLVLWLQIRYELYISWYGGFKPTFTGSWQIGDLYN